MRNWIKQLEGSPIDWLLEWSNPSIRCLALRDILEKGEKDSEVEAAREAIPSSPIVSRIMAKQSPEGCWEDPTSPYLPKYKSTYWQVMILSQLGMGKTDERIRKACRYIFRFQHDQGGFLCYGSEQARREYEYLRKKGKRLPSLDKWAERQVYEQQLSCLTGNVAVALIRMGFASDSRVRKALEWLVKVQNEDGGWLCPYWGAHARDTHGCFYGTICPLEALSEYPKEQLSAEMRSAIARGAEFLLMHRLFKADHHGYQVINKSWLRLGFPWFAGYNILRGLDVLTKLGYTQDDRLSDAVQVLLQKRQDDGRWMLEATPTGRMQTNIEAKGRPSKWITLISLRVLKQLL